MKIYVFEPNNDFNIFDKNITVIEANNQRWLCEKDIGNIHNMFYRYIRKKIKNNDSLKEYVDYIDLKNSNNIENIDAVFEALGYESRSISYAKNIYLLSKQGYIKFFRSIQKNRKKSDHKIANNIINEYFVVSNMGKIDINEQEKLDDNFLLNIIKAQNRKERLNVIQNYLTALNIDTPNYDFKICFSDTLKTINKKNLYTKNKVPVLGDKSITQKSIKQSISYIATNAILSKTKPFTVEDIINEIKYTHNVDGTKNGIVQKIITNLQDNYILYKIDDYIYVRRPY